MVQRGRPWHKYSGEINRAHGDFALAKEFGWDDDKIQNLPNERRKLYLSMLKGFGMAKVKE